MKIASIADLYLDQLQDMHSSERQIIKALPKMVRTATHPALKHAFSAHLKETKEHLDRLNIILEGLGKGPGRKVCRATVGLIEEGSEMIDSTDDADARDAGLICAAQKIEHYEIATYGCLRAFASLLERSKDAKLLELTLADEKNADETLTGLATSVINADALA